MEELKDKLKQIRKIILTSIAVMMLFISVFSAIVGIFCMKEFFFVPMGISIVFFVSGLILINNI